MTQAYKLGIVKGYKATDKDMKCRGLQYVLNEWQEVAEGEIIKCGANGLHFCIQPSGVWSYYSDEGTRVFECEAEGVLDEPFEPGADAKSVARRIRLVREVFPGGDSNTGHRNTGYSNTGIGNATNYSAGFFCTQEPTLFVFDVDSGLSRDEFTSKFPEYLTLSRLLLGSESIDFEQFKDIPGIAPEKLKLLHEKHIAARK
jgi:hypothetical protein